MRSLLVIIATLAALSTRAQVPTPLFVNPSFPPPTFDNRWHLTPTVGLSAGYLFYNGGISYAAVPASLFLSHALNKNFTGFGGVTAAPVLFNTNQLFTQPGLNTPGYLFAGVAGVQAGLIYTNDAKTFSISGSVSIDRGYYPTYTPHTETRK